MPDPVGLEIALPLSDDVDPRIRSFAEDVVKNAAKLAESSGVFTVEQILRQAGLVAGPTATRMRKKRKIRAWDVCRRECKLTMEGEKLKPHAGTGFGGRPGFDGDYMKACKELYAEPEKRGYYKRKAAAENADDELLTLERLPKAQKKMLGELQSLALSAADKEIHVCLLAVPSTTSMDGIVVRSAGYGEAFYALMDDKGGYQRFKNICRGGADLARTENVKKKDQRRPMKDSLRTEATEKLLELINSASSNVYGELRKLPRKPGALNAELERRKLRCITPPSDVWPKDPVELEALLTTRSIGPLQQLQAALEDGSVHFV